MKKILIGVLALLFLTGCGHVQLKSDTAEIAAGTIAVTAGYLIGKNNPEKVADWNQWIDRIVSFEAGDSVLNFEVLLSKGFNLVIDEPFLELQFNKLIRLLEFPELQPPSAAFLTADYMNFIRLVLQDFRDGLGVGQLEANA